MMMNPRHIYHICPYYSDNSVRDALVATVRACLIDMVICFIASCSLLAAAIVIGLFAN